MHQVSYRKVDIDGFNIPAWDAGFFDTCHFALGTHCDETAVAIQPFLGSLQVN